MITRTEIDTHIQKLIKPHENAIKLFCSGFSGHEKIHIAGLDLLFERKGDQIQLLGRTEGCLEGAIYDELLNKAKTIKKEVENRESGLPSHWTDFELFYCQNTGDFSVSPTDEDSQEENILFGHASDPLAPNMLGGLLVESENLGINRYGYPFPKKKLRYTYEGKSMVADIWEAAKSRSALASEKRYFSVRRYLDFLDANSTLLFFEGWDFARRFIEMDDTEEATWRKFVYHFSHGTHLNRQDYTREIIDILPGK